MNSDEGWACAESEGSLTKDEKEESEQVEVVGPFRESYKTKPIRCSEETRSGCSG